MNKYIKKVSELSGILIQVGIVLIITGSVFRVLNTPGTEIYVTISKVLAGLFSVIAFFEIVYSGRISFWSKLIWIFCLINFNIFAVLFYFFKRPGFDFFFSIKSFLRHQELKPHQ